VAGEEGRAVRGGVEAGAFGTARDLSPLRGWHALRFEFPALTRWANVCRASGAGAEGGLKSSPRLDLS
jgi:hypothetical protein